MKFLKQALTGKLAATAIAIMFVYVVGGARQSVLYAATREFIHGNGAVPSVFNRLPTARLKSL